MKIQKFNEVKTNYSNQILINIIQEANKLSDIIFEYYYYIEDIDIEEEYISPRNITIDGNSIMLYFDTEYETNSNYKITDIDDLLLFINNKNIYKNSKKYNL